MGVETVLAGLDAGMAITLVEMGMDLKGVRTALNLEGALEYFGTIPGASARRSGKLEESVPVKPPSNGGSLE